MSAMGGGGPGEDGPDLDLDLDLRAGGDAQVSALFREGLRPRGGGWPDLGAIERRAQRRHRRGQAVASGAAATAAVMAAVLVVIAPWSAHRGGPGVPAVPTPTVTRTEPPTPPEQVLGVAMDRLAGPTSDGQDRTSPGTGENQ